MIKSEVKCSVLCYVAAFKEDRKIHTLINIFFYVTLCNPEGCNKHADVTSLTLFQVLVWVCIQTEGEIVNKERARLGQTWSLIGPSDNVK